VPFRELAASERGNAAVIAGATLLAQTAWDALHDPALIEAAWAEFGRPGTRAGP
jgi:hypothetical protein